MPNLLDLPREIRDEIYYHLLAGTREIRLSTRNPDNTLPDVLHNLPPVRGLGLTRGLVSNLHLACRQTRIELFETFYEQTSLEISTSVTGIESNIFRELSSHVPQAVRRQIQKCSLQVLWKPRTGSRRNAVAILRAELPDLCKIFPRLKTLAIEVRFYDARDLKNEIRDGSFVPEQLARIPTELPIENAAISLTALTKLLRQNRNHHFDVTARTLPDPEYYLTVETYVIWRFSPCSEPHAWEGLFPYASSFTSWGQETETMEQLEQVITEKFNREHEKSPRKQKS